MLIFKLSALCSPRPPPPSSEARKEGRGQEGAEGKGKKKNRAINTGEDEKRMVKGREEEKARELVVLAVTGNMLTH